MNLLLIEREELDGDRVRLTGDRARHVREVLRAVVGQRLRVGVVDDAVGEGELLRIEDGAIELRVERTERPPRPRLDVILAVPRPKTLAKLLPDLVSLGVDRLVLIRTWKVEKPYLDSPLLTAEGHRALLRAGAMQARTPHLPVIQVEPLFRPWIEDRAPALAAGAALRWVLHPLSARRTADATLDDPDARAVIAIGPEAGFVDFEVERFEAAGFEAVTMGPRPLRVEVAAVAAIAQLDLLRAQARPR